MRVYGAHGASELAQKLRGIESRSKGEMLKAAADILDELSDPVHAMGGVYCHECTHNIFGVCGKAGLRRTKQDGFCNYGEREENG